MDKIIYQITLFIGKTFPLGITPGIIFLFFYVMPILSFMSFLVILFFLRCKEDRNINICLCLFCLSITYIGTITTVAGDMGNIFFLVSPFFLLLSTLFSIGSIFSSFTKQYSTKVKMLSLSTLIPCTSFYLFLVIMAHSELG